MIKKTTKELKQKVESEAEKLQRQKKARSDDTKRKILIGAYLLKKYDNDVKKFLAENPEFMLIVRETDKRLFES